MALPDLVRSMIDGPVRSIAGQFEAPVVLNKLTGRNTYGPTYGPNIPTQAVVDLTSETVAANDGTQKVTSGHFMFLDRSIVVAEGDRITLNGVMLTVVKAGGQLDETGKAYVPEAWTGK